MGFKVEEKFRIILVMQEVNLTNVFGLYARWRFKALTFNLALMMIEAQMFNLLLHRHWRKTRVTGWCGLVAQTFNYAQK